MTLALQGDEWSAARPGRTLPPGKTRYPFYRRLPFKVLNYNYCKTRAIYFSKSHIHTAIEEHDRRVLLTYQCAHHLKSYCIHTSFLFIFKTI